VEIRKLNNSKIINPKYFITLPDLDRDVVLEKNVIQSITNLHEADESDIIVEPEPELETKKSVLIEGVDVSSSNEINDDDEEAEVVESNSIFDNDDLSSDQSEYAKNICITNSSKSEVMSGGEFKRKAIISADSSSLYE
jgi:hypothetical protein